MNCDVLRNILLVGSGSFFGGAARYALSLMMKDLSKGFPWATLAANLLGCLLIGCLGLFQPWSQWKQQLGSLSDCRLLRRLYDLLHFLQGSLNDDTIRQCLGLCRLCSLECHSRHCPGRIGIFSHPRLCHEIKERDLSAHGNAHRQKRGFRHRWRLLYEWLYHA